MINRWAFAAIAAIAVPLAAAAADWNLTFAVTDRGHRVGNPDAPVQLVEFVSYTCPHCAHFEAESDAGLRMMYLHSGRASVEVRSYLRNPIDLAATLVAQCGDPGQFFANHRALMLGQETWIAKAQAATPAQQQRWSNGDFGARMRAIGDDLDFHELMEPRGLSRSQVDRCLSDEAAAHRIVEANEADRADFNIPGTPSFAINGQLLDNVHSWDMLQPALDAAAASATGGE
ncbi:MAG: thioredoxin domain-containing protein [Erythrobacter sp.]|nr:thioredoxin domain-containing protein [Erythrobacter sp.]